jgi:glycerophosphoryl diester phosphodiesterase
MSRPLVIAHRGASAIAPESTAAAMREAAAAGADMVELDVQLTRDRRLVVFHDDRLDRTTDGTGPLEHYAYRELAHLDAGGWFAPRFAGQRILLASQALRALPNRRVNLELKPTRRRAQLVERLVRCLRWTRSATRVLISSFDPGLIRLVRRRRPGLATALVCDRNFAGMLRAATRLGCRAIHPKASLVTEAAVRRAHEAGLRVHVWTVDHPAFARRLARWGVDGVFANDPRRLRLALERNGR